MQQSASDKQGPHEERFRDGTLSARGRLAAWKRVGVWKFSYRNEASGVKTGEWKVFDERGRSSRTQTFGSARRSASRQARSARASGRKA